MSDDLEKITVRRQEKTRVRESKPLPENAILIGQEDPRYEPVYFSANSLGHLADYHSTPQPSASAPHEDISMALGNWCVSPDGQKFTEITDIFKISGSTYDPRRPGEIIIPAKALAEANQNAATILNAARIGIIHDHRGTTPLGQEAHPPVPTIPGDLGMMHHICPTPEHLFIIIRPLKDGTTEIALWRNDPDEKSNLVPQKGFYLVGQHEGFRSEKVKIYTQSYNIQPERITIDVE